MALGHWADVPIRTDLTLAVWFRCKSSPLGPSDFSLSVTRGVSLKEYILLLLYHLIARL